jgi:hypothetical protein
MDLAGALHDLGGTHKRHGRLPEAEQALRAALAISPSAKTRHALGIVLLSQGRYAEGWPLYNARHEIPELGLTKPSLNIPEWNGASLSGRRLVIFPEQGFGDQIMFARFAPYLRSKGADVTLICNPLLARLFDGLADRVLGASGPVDFPDPDYWTMSGSIAGYCCGSPRDIPSKPYLFAEPRESIGRIGIVTKGNPKHANDANRSLPEDDAVRLLSLPGSVSLGLEDLSVGDLVISVDTAVAHLAGALGKPVWVLLPSLMTDWRWMEGRHDSPWYPSARLFRKAANEPWAAVVSRVIQSL